LQENMRHLCQSGFYNQTQPKAQSSKGHSQTLA